MNRIFSFIYGVVCYLIFFCTFLYLMGFLANAVVPKSIDSGTSTNIVLAFVVNLGLILLFGIQHSVMARPAFKKLWTRVVPRVIERSTYVLFSSLLLVVMYVAWQPMTGIVWQASNSITVGLGWAVFGSGFALVLLSTFLIDHFELFGLKQVLMNLLNKVSDHTSFQVQYLYRYVRHPLYVGWILAFWGTPVMTVGHLMFALGMTSYILIAIKYEERDLAMFHGQAYEHYKEEVPMLVPHPGHVHPSVKPASHGAH